MGARGARTRKGDELICHPSHYDGAPLRAKPSIGLDDYDHAYPVNRSSNSGAAAVGVGVAALAAGSLILVRHQRRCRPNDSVPVSHALAPC